MELAKFEIGKIYRDEWNRKVKILSRDDKNIKFELHSKYIIISKILHYYNPVWRKGKLIDEWNTERIITQKTCGRLVDCVAK